MDPVSHALFGRLMAGFDRRTALGPGSRAAFVLGAMAPDLDILLVPRGWDVYLHAHQAWTHAPVLSPAVALLVAGVVRVCSRGSALVRVWLAAWIGVVVGHLMFDLASGSDMQLLWPFSTARFGPHLLSMSDAIAVAILVIATVISVRQRRLAAWLTVGALAVLLAVKAASQSAARDVFRARVANAPDEMAVRHPDAVNGRLFLWTFYDRSGPDVRAWRVDARTRAATLLFSDADSADAGAIAASRRLPVVATFLRLAHLPFPQRVTRDSRTFILWSDPRFCDARRCYLSFGAELDAHDLPRDQVIWIGDYEQVRALPVATGHPPE
jgi:membrane-bound metal-dependent hydrolase YbcI (DUF457 family)